MTSCHKNKTQKQKWGSKKKQHHKKDSSYLLTLEMCQKYKPKPKHERKKYKNLQ